MSLRDANDLTQDTAEWRKTTATNQVMVAAAVQTTACKQSSGQYVTIHLFCWLWHVLVFRKCKLKWSTVSQFGLQQLCSVATCYNQRCANPKILRPHQSADSDHRPHLQADAVSDPLSVRDSLSDHFPTGPSRSRVSNPCERGWDIEVQLTAAAAEHGQSRGEEGLTEIKRVRQRYSICSLCSAGELTEWRAWVNDPRQSASANFQAWAVHVHPRTLRKACVWGRVRIRTSLLGTDLSIIWLYGTTLQSL